MEKKYIEHLLTLNLSDAEKLSYILAMSVVKKERNTISKWCEDMYDTGWGELNTTWDLMALLKFLHDYSIIRWRKPEWFKKYSDLIKLGAEKREYLLKFVSCEPINLDQFYIPPPFYDSKCIYHNCERGTFNHISDDGKQLQKLYCDKHTRVLKGLLNKAVIK